MKLPILTLLGAALLTAADTPSDEAGKKDLERMQGDWARVELVLDGQKYTGDDALGAFRTVKGDHYTVFRWEKPIGGGTFKIDASQKPRTIDLFPSNSPTGKPIKAIYEWDGERLRICNAAPGKDRPTDFSAKAGSGHTVNVWERERK